MTEIAYISPDHVIAINRDLGYSIRERETVEAQVMRCQQGFGGFDPYPTVWDKAAVLLHGLSRTQGFTDGNKRTAWVSCLTFLAFNDLRIDTMVIDAELMALCAATGLIESDKVKEWLIAHHRTPANPSTKRKVSRTPEMLG